MSIKALDRVWEHSKEKGTARLLLLAIADYADDDGFAWPGIETLASKINMSPRQTTRSIISLSKRNEVYVYHRRGRGNLYILLIGSTLERLARAVGRAEKFGAKFSESDKVSLIERIQKSEQVTPASVESDIATSVKTAIATAGDPSIPVIEPSFYSPLAAENPPVEPDDAWLAESRIVEAPTIQVPEKKPIPSDPLAHAVQFAASQPINWAVPPEAGGHDDFAGAPLAAFCEFVGIDRRGLSAKKAKDWAGQLHKIADEWRAGPGLMAGCIRAMPDSEFGFKAYSTPFAQSFVDDLGVLLARALIGKCITNKTQEMTDDGRVIIRVGR